VFPAWTSTPGTAYDYNQKRNNRYQKGTSITRQDSATSAQVTWSVGVFLQDHTVTTLAQSKFKDLE
jgi:hypothetical protein